MKGIPYGKFHSINLNFYNSPKVSDTEAVQCTVQEVLFFDL